MSNHGGKRPGAGRKMSPAKKALIEAARNVVVSGEETPLEYMLRIMRDPNADMKRRDQMAMGAAPFIHPKLAAVEHSGNKDNPVGIALLSAVPRDDADTDDHDQPSQSH